MKHIYLNLKRFDIAPEYGGVNLLAPSGDWARAVMCSIQKELEIYDPMEVDFTVFFPEMHILSALGARSLFSPVRIGCQGVHWADTEVGGNFGAFTSSRPAAAMAAAGCEAVLIGHCEERTALGQVLAEAGVYDSGAVNRLLGREVRCAAARGLKILYCIGEKSEEQEHWQEVLGRQMDIGLSGAEDADIVIGYEPVWSIGPGKTPADRAYIQKVARFVKERTNGRDVVYGGGLKQENAATLASIPELDGGLIALTRFSGAIGFYPGEYLEIVRRYMDGEQA